MGPIGRAAPVTLRMTTAMFVKTDCYQYSTQLIPKSFKFYNEFVISYMPQIL